LEVTAKRPSSLFLPALLVTALKLLREGTDRNGMPKGLIVAIITDLMFTVKVQDAARRSEIPLVFAKTKNDVLGRGPEPTAAIILDLDLMSPDALTTLSELKQDEATKHIPVIGFVSHVRADRIQGARELGCEVVMARSAFVQNLPELLGKYAQP
jgi:CheY-like chemotaxis protein